MTYTPTKIGTKSGEVKLFAAGSSNFDLNIPQNFPLVLETNQKQEILQQVSQFDLDTIKLSDITQIGAEVSQTLNKSLDAFLKTIDAKEEPKIYGLVKQLNTSVETEHLDSLADTILNPKPTTWERIKGFVTHSDVVQDAWTKVRTLTGQKTSRIADLISNMESTLSKEIVRLTNEVNNQEKIKDQYSDSFDQFAMIVLYTNTCLEKSKKRFEELKATEPNGSSRLEDFRDKLEALESRALSLEGALSKLPAQQLVIRQLQNAGISTIRETTTTASERFADIKMTLLAINGALMVQSLQQLDSANANLSNNLQLVQSKLMKQVVTTAATAPGRNRLDQANRLRNTVQSVKELQDIIENARVQNTTAFDETHRLFSDARSDMIQLGNVIKPTAKLIK